MPGAGPIIDGMDIVAHALWAGAGIAAASHRIRVSPRIVVATIIAAVLPDIVQLLPLLMWVSSSDAAFATISAYSLASPGTEPTMPDLVGLATHHLHCIAHSAVVAAPVTAICVAISRATLIPLLGWWSHIVIDVFTHSAEYYPSPVLYPITMRGFDGIAWNDPMFMAFNYVALAFVFIGLVVVRVRRGRRHG